MHKLKRKRLKLNLETIRDLPVTKYADAAGGSKATPWEPCDEGGTGAGAGCTSTK